LSLENFEGDAFGCNYSATIFDSNVSQFNLDVRRILANRFPNEVWIDRIVEYLEGLANMNGRLVGLVAHLIDFWKAARRTACKIGIV
jgi:hypothetical protein